MWPMYFGQGEPILNASPFLTFDDEHYPKIVQYLILLFSGVSKGVSVVMKVFIEHLDISLMKYRSNC